MRRALRTAKVSLPIMPRPSSRPPVADLARLGPLRQVVGDRRHVARPRLVQPHRAVGEMLVLVGVEAQVRPGRSVPAARRSRASSCVGSSVLTSVTPLRSSAIASPSRSSSSIADPAGDVGRLPEALVGVAQLRGVVVGEEVVAPGDPGGVDRVGDRVARALVVPGVDQRGPDVAAEVRDVGEVERLQDPARDEQRDEGLGRDEDVEPDRAAGELRDRLVDRREGAQFDLRRRSAFRTT